MTHEPDRTALVTAGASGIGRSIAKAFLEAGWRVHICDIDSDAIERFLNEQDRATATVASVASQEQVEQLFADFSEHHARLDVLVNNAGVAGPTAAVEDIDPDDWNATLATDLTGPFLMTRSAVPLIEATGGGSIINIASNAALFGFPLRSPYAASKWGLIGLTKTWAMELGPRNIAVNAICPGSVNGDRIEGVIERDAAERGLTPKEIRDTYLRQSSMRLFIDAEDVASMALFLASPGGKKISGQVIAIDGHTESLSTPFD